jgi:hypothetical protein
MMNLRRFAAGNVVVDDLIAAAFGLRDRQITREVWREKGGALDRDAIPAGEL